MKLWLKLLIGIPLALVAVALLVLGYLGFIPGLSNLMGAATPRDLGVRYTDADLERLHTKGGVAYATLPATADPKESINIIGSKPVEIAASSEEMTALINDIDSRWVYWPTSKTQLKINTDGTVEMSGILNMDVLDEYAEATDMPEGYMDALNNYSGLILTNPRFYVKTRGYAEDGQFDGDQLEVEIGRVQIPEDVLRDNQEAIKSFVSERVEAAGIDADSLTVENGQFAFNGTIPTEYGFSPP